MMTKKEEQMALSVLYAIKHSDDRDALIDALISMLGEFVGGDPNT